MFDRPAQIIFLIVVINLNLLDEDQWDGADVCWITRSSTNVTNSETILDHKVEFSEYEDSGFKVCITIVDGIILWISCEQKAITPRVQNVCILLLTILPLFELENLESPRLQWHFQLDTGHNMLILEREFWMLPCEGAYEETSHFELQEEIVRDTKVDDPEGLQRSLEINGSLGSVLLTHSTRKLTRLGRERGNHHFPSPQQKALTLVSILLAAAAGAAAGADAPCPDNCQCAARRMRCPDWADALPPNASSAIYEELDLSADEGSSTDAPSAGGRKRRCDEARSHTARSVLSTCGAAPGHLGAALVGGLLPAAWLGADQFVWLRVLSLRGALLCALHKDALRPQNRLENVDLSRNLLRELNVFTWRRHPMLKQLSLADNPELEMPADVPLLYSSTLRHLDLSGCALCHLPPGVFDGTPELDELVLRDNCFAALPAQALPPPKGLALSVLDLARNLLGGVRQAYEADAMARVGNATLDENPWPPGCNIASSSGEKVTFSNGSTSTWEEVGANTACRLTESSWQTTTTTTVFTITREPEINRDILAAGDVPTRKPDASPLCTEENDLLGHLEYTALLGKVCLAFTFVNLLLALAVLVVYMYIRKRKKDYQQVSMEYHTRSEASGRRSGEIRIRRPAADDEDEDNNVTDG